MNIYGLCTPFVSCRPKWRAEFYPHPYDKQRSSASPDDHDCPEIMCGKFTTLADEQFVSTPDSIGPRTSSPIENLDISGENVSGQSEWLLGDQDEWEREFHKRLQRDSENFQKEFEMEADQFWNKISRNGEEVWREFEKSAEYFWTEYKREKEDFWRKVERDSDKILSEMWSIHEHPSIPNDAEIGEQYVGSHSLNNKLTNVKGKLPNAFRFGKMSPDKTKNIHVLD